MAGQSDSPLALTAGEAITAAWLRVKADGRTVYMADAADYGIGTLQKVCASGDIVTIRLDAEGTSKMVASGAVSAQRKRC